MFTWSLQSNLRTLKQIIKSPLRPSTIQNTKRFAKKQDTQSSFSAHTDMVYSTIWIGNLQCNVPRTSENISDTLYKMNDLFKSGRLIQRYYNCTGIFQMDSSITSLHVVV